MAEKDLPPFELLKASCDDSSYTANANAMVEGNYRTYNIRNIAYRLLPRRATVENAMMLEAMIRNHADVIYGEGVYERNALVINELHLWEPHPKPMMVWATKRRSNKTNVLAAFAAAMLIIVPNANVGSFSAGVNLVERVKSMLDDNPSVFPTAAVNVKRSSGAFSFDMGEGDTRCMRHFSLRDTPRGVYASVILIDEPWYVDQDAFHRVVAPMFMVRETRISAIGTPSNHPRDTEFQKLFEDPLRCDANRPSEKNKTGFSPDVVEERKEACRACGKLGSCAHGTVAVPEWQRATKQTPGHSAL